MTPKASVWGAEPPVGDTTGPAPDAFTTTAPPPITSEVPVAWRPATGTAVVPGPNTTGSEVTVMAIRSADSTAAPTAVPAAATALPAAANACSNVDVTAEPWSAPTLRVNAATDGCDTRSYPAFETRTYTPMAIITDATIIVDPTIICSGSIYVFDMESPHPVLLGDALQLLARTGSTYPHLFDVSRLATVYAALRRSAEMLFFIYSLSNQYAPDPRAIALTAQSKACLSGLRAAHYHHAEQFRALWPSTPHHHGFIEVGHRLQELDTAADSDTVQIKRPMFPKKTVNTFDVTPHLHYVLTKYGLGIRPESAEVVVAAAQAVEKGTFGGLGTGGPHRLYTTAEEAVWTAFAKRGWSDAQIRDLLSADIDEIPANRDGVTGLQVAPEILWVATYLGRLGATRIEGLFPPFPPDHVTYLTEFAPPVGASRRHATTPHEAIGVNALYSTICVDGLLPDDLSILDGGVSQRLLDELAGVLHGFIECAGMTLSVGRIESALDYTLMAARLSSALVEVSALQPAVLATRPSVGTLGETLFQMMMMAGVPVGKFGVRRVTVPAA